MSALALGIVSGGCTKLNAAFGDAGGTSGEHDGGTEPVATSTPEPATSGGPGATTPSTTSGGESISVGDGGDSTVADDTVGATSGTTGERGSDTGKNLPPWTPACVFDPTAGECDPVIEVGAQVLCLFGFELTGDPDCEADLVGLLDLQVAAGDYVLGSLQLPLARFRVDGEDEELLACTTGTPAFHVAEPSTVHVEIWNDMGMAALFYVRRVDDLCEVPSNCCTPSTDSAIDACEEDGLRACVVQASGLCEGSWDFHCVRTAMLRCGADCT